MFSIIRRLQALDALRGVAVLLVIGRHLWDTAEGDRRIFGPEAFDDSKTILVQR